MRRSSMEVNDAPGKLVYLSVTIVKESLSERPRPTLILGSSRERSDCLGNLLVVWANPTLSIGRSLYAIEQKCK